MRRSTVAGSSAAKPPLFVVQVTPLRLVLAILGLIAIAAIPAIIVGLASNGGWSGANSSSGGGAPTDGPRVLKAVPGATIQLKLTDGSPLRVTLVNIWNPVQPNIAVRVEGPAGAQSPSAWTLVLDNGTEIALADAPGDTSDTIRLYVDRPLPGTVNWTAVRFAPAGLPTSVVFERK
jgi:hypothetical protein